MSLFLKIGIGGPSQGEREAAQKAMITMAKAAGLGPSNWKALGKLASDSGGFLWEWYQSMEATVFEGARSSIRNLFSFFPEEENK